MNRIAFSSAVYKSLPAPDTRAKHAASGLRATADTFVSQPEKAIAVTSPDKFARRACRFQGEGRRGGTKYDPDIYFQKRALVYPILVERVEQWNKLSLGKLYPDIQKAYDALGIPDWVGIPPLMSTQQPGSDGASKKDTRPY